MNDRLLYITDEDGYLTVEEDGEDVQLTPAEARMLGIIG